jgi:hypothetical protein
LNNVHRRQLNREEIDAVIGYWLKRFPRHGNKRIADDIGVSHHTVEEKRVELEAVGQIAKLDKYEGKDGKLYPRAKTKRSASKAEPAEEPEDTTSPHAELYGVPVWFDREPITAEQPASPPGWQPWIAENAEASGRTIRRYIRIAEHWDEVANLSRVTNLSLRKALELLADEPEEPPAEQVEEEPELHSPPEIFGVPVWFEDGEQEVSIIRRSCSEGRRDCAQSAPSHLSNAPQRCRNSTGDVAAKSTHPESVVICDFHSSATRSAALSWPLPVRGGKSRGSCHLQRQRWNSVGRWQRFVRSCRGCSQSAPERVPIRRGMAGTNSCTLISLWSSVPAFDFPELSFPDGALFLMASAATQ